MLSRARQQDAAYVRHASERLMRTLPSELSRDAPAPQQRRGADHRAACASGRRDNAVRCCLELAVVFSPDAAARCYDAARLIRRGHDCCRLLALLCLPLLLMPHTMLQLMPLLRHVFSLRHGAAYYAVADAAITLDASFFADAITLLMLMMLPPFLMLLFITLPFADATLLLPPLLLPLIALKMPTLMACLRHDDDYRHCYYARQPLFSRLRR